MPRLLLAQTAGSESLCLPPSATVAIAFPAIGLMFVFILRSWWLSWRFYKKVCPEYSGLGICWAPMRHPFRVYSRESRALPEFRQVMRSTVFLFLPFLLTFAAIVFVQPYICMPAQ